MQTSWNRCCYDWLWHVGNPDTHVSVRAAILSDATAVAQLHKTAIPTAFLSSLRTDVLANIYRSMSGSPHATLAVAADGSQQVVGFVSGANSVKAFYLDFIRSRFAWKAGWSFLISAQRHIPSLALRAFETVQYPFRKKATATDLPSAELLSIAVDEQWRGTPVAAQLMEALKHDFRQCDEQQFKVVVGEGNLRARRYYEKMGGQLAARIEVHQGNTSCVYIFSVEH